MKVSSLFLYQLSGCANTSTAKLHKQLCLPCDVAILMCDPEWKIKTGVEILLFIHRPHEDFSDLLGRWRQTQVLLDKDYEWLMHPRHSHILSEGANTIYPLFVVFSETSERIQRGLGGCRFTICHASILYFNGRRSQWTESYCFRKSINLSRIKKSTSQIEA